MKQCKFWRGVQVMLYVAYMGCPLTSLQAAESFGLPTCVHDFGGETVLNAAALEAMIARAAPAGELPNRPYEKFFIVMQHNLEQTQGLLLLAGVEAGQRPLLLKATCAPYAEAPTHIRTYIANLTPERSRALLTYYQAVAGPSMSPAPRVAASSAKPQDARVAFISAGTLQREDGQPVTLEAFMLDRHEVTNMDYQGFIDTGGYTNDTHWSEAGWTWLQDTQRRQPSYREDERFSSSTQPVVGVSWYEADAYCRWAGKLLPTELQWERACRGEDGRIFPWGNEPLSDGESASKQASGELTFTAPMAVGSTPATQSPDGVYDLAANAQEWTSTQTDTGGRILRGGSGKAGAPHTGCGVRTELLPGMTANFVGFRCQSTSP